MQLCLHVFSDSYGSYCLGIYLLGFVPCTIINVLTHFEGITASASGQTELLCYPYLSLQRKQIQKAEDGGSAFLRSVRIDLSCME
jgi:hypothetical protein